MLCFQIFQKAQWGATNNKLHNFLLLETTNAGVLHYMVPAVICMICDRVTFPARLCIQWIIKWHQTNSYATYKEGASESTHWTWGKREIATTSANKTASV